MKRYFLILILLLAGVFTAIGISRFWQTTEKVSSSNKLYEKILKQDLFSLLMAYPEDILDIELADNNQVYLVMKSGKKLLYDDKRDKTELEKLQNPDLQDMMEQQYTLGWVEGLMPQEYNPGRIRVYPLLKEVYGSSQSEIEKNLTGISIGSNHHRFNERNAAAYHLKKAMTELHQQANNVPSLWSFIHPIGGTYNYRHISQTNRLSPHAFGISIDLALHKSDYWQWATRDEGERRLKSYPKELVHIMESNYFVWGGKWGYFDILHFEYRPEIIIKALYFTNEGKTLWYENLPVKNEKVNNIILLIEERLRNYSSLN